jgi:hypothetical protein
MERWAAGFFCWRPEMSEQQTGDGLDLEALVERLADVVLARLGAAHDRLLDRRELAERLGMSERGVSGLVARGELPDGYLCGGLRRWDWGQVLKFLESRADRRPRKGRGRYPRAG